MVLNLQWDLYLEKQKAWVQISSFVSITVIICILLIFSFPNLPFPVAYKWSCLSSHTNRSWITSWYILLDHNLNREVGRRDLAVPFVHSLWVTSWTTAAQSSILLCVIFITLTINTAQVQRQVHVKVTLFMEHNRTNGSDVQFKWDAKWTHSYFWRTIREEPVGLRFQINKGLFQWVRDYALCHNYIGFKFQNILCNYQKLIIFENLLLTFLFYFINTWNNSNKKT